MVKKKKKSRIGFQVAAGVFDVIASAGAGLAIVICTVAAAAICAVLFPVEEEDAP